MNLTHIKYLSLFALLVNAAAMLSPIINGGDSITYAALSQHISLSNDWANLMLDGKDWLDKPHMQFWITALSFELLGVSTFAYILPGFLFHIIGGFFTYRLARLFYSREAAWLSVLVYVSVFHLMDSSIEVKAETYLTGFIMGACYYWLRYDAQARLKYLLLGAAFTAGAVMTKGVFTMITITSGLVILWMYQKQWSKLWSMKWWLAFALSLLFTAPEVIALYLQFDAHPEKVVFGQTNVSGIKFFLWDSQFGRFFNAGPIQDTSGGGHPFYFVLVFLWAFLPWVAVFFAAMFAGVRKFAQRSVEENAGFVFLCGAFFVTFSLFSATSFQLDHYTVILFPFAAILCGKYLSDRMQNLHEGRALMIAQVAFTLLLLALAIGLSVHVGYAVVISLIALMVSAMLGYAVMQRQRMRANVLLVFPLFGMLALYAFVVLTSALTFAAYSVAYNANRQLAGKPAAPVYSYNMGIVSRELAVYNTAPVFPAVSPEQLPTSGRYYLLVSEKELTTVASTLAHYEQIGQGDWVVHKTGTFPRFLKLARGEAPLEDIRIFAVN
ncbi:MAG: glycosyltransferase family 39 protein [Gammaproteobacteria bacterium]|nr:glycosyltransferase family 39 protein [Gammaproteobacteria bacterium]